MIVSDRRIRRRRILRQWLLWGGWQSMTGALWLFGLPALGSGRVLMLLFPGGFPATSRARATRRRRLRRFWFGRVLLCPGCLPLLPVLRLPVLEWGFRRPLLLLRRELRCLQKIL